MRNILVFTLLVCAFPALGERWFRRSSNTQYYTPSQNSVRQTTNTQNGMVYCSKCGGYHAPHHAATSVSNSGYVSNGGSDLISLINNYRSQNGLNPIAYDSRLNISDSPGHRGFNRSGMSGATNWSSETNPQAIFNQWLDSPGHKANMLNPNITRGGIAPGTKGGTTFTAQ